MRTCPMWAAIAAVLSLGQAVGQVRHITVAYQLAAVNVSGTWTVVFGGRTTTTMTLRQTGNTVTGDLVTPDATPGAVTGQISGTSLTLSRNTGLDTIQHYQLTVQGDSFSGTYRNEGKVRDSGSFTGTRQAASVAGTWNVVFKGSTTSTMTLQQNGTEVTGNLVTPDATPGAVTGQINGTSLTLSRNTGLDTIQHYQVTVQGESFTGTYRNQGRVQDSGSFNGTRTASASAAGGMAGGMGSRRAPQRRIANERALDLCRAEVHSRGVRDYGFANIDITSVGVDTSQGRRNWVTGTFTEGGGGYRFNCSVDYGSGQVGTVEILRPNGSALQPRTSSGTYSSGSPYGAGNISQPQILRACQDAVVARVNQAGYQNVQFTATGIDPQRSGWVTGTVAASRVLVTDTFDFGCSMDFGAARVLDVQLNRR